MNYARTMYGAVFTLCIVRSVFDNQTFSDC